MRRQLLPALLMTLAMLVITGVLYPLAVWAVGTLAFGDKADGSLVSANGTVVGSRLLGQAFAGATYFHPRPSGNPNLGPSNRALVDTLHTRLAAYRAENGLRPDTPVPGDAVTDSASGLDPGISVANAEIQARRVASARGRPLANVLAAVRRHTEHRPLGFLGESTVNVLELNLDLDRLGP